jgi:hypothetical protein
MALSALRAAMLALKVPWGPLPRATALTSFQRHAVQTRQDSSSQIAGSRTENLGEVAVISHRATCPPATRCCTFLAYPVRASVDLTHARQDAEASPMALGAADHALLDPQSAVVGRVAQWRSSIRNSARHGVELRHRPVPQTM